MAENHVLLETIELTQSAATVTFDNLPSSGYTDLKIIISARCTDTTVNKWVAGHLRFNGDSSNLNSITNAGRWNSVDSFTDGSTAYCFWLSGSDTTANSFGVTEITIPDYLSTSQNKLYSSDWAEANNDTFYQILGHSGGRWSSNSAITSVTLIPQVGSIASGSTFSLYGIAALGTTPTFGPKATGGNLVATDGTYWYHAFTSSGNFIPQTSLNAKVMVVGGGAGGGAHIAGGGGAGAINDFTSTYTLNNNTTYLCTIGAGGGGNTGTAKGSPGISSVFSGSGTTITANGGGYGGGNDVFPGGPGGSGGGAAASGGGAAGGTSSGSNTFAGGSGWYGPYPIYSAGGGGGATAAGGNGSTTASVGGNGGQGMLLSSIDSNLTTVLAGALSGMTRVSSGGGGCGQNPAGGAQTGGVGGAGGGNGGFGSTNATNATSYGSGGGGGNWSDAGGGATGDGGNGYQGIVIIRYAME